MSTERNPALPLTFIPVTNLIPRERRMIRNMAGALNAAFQIAPGRELVIHLGLGGERSNLEALETWVCQQMLTHRMHPSRESMGWYVSQLESTLNCIEEEKHD
ncbi:MAG: Uncharacterized protein AWU57_1310 [Marinobacter sp. T13-3]|nr:MAG: Uncharacterized protein AWU57_1310 [Marinobacter sp. T13-3]